MFMLSGNVIVGQSGGPTSVINSSLVGVYKTAKDCGVKKVFGMRHGIEGLLNEQYIDMSDYIKSDLDIELLKRTPSSFLGTCRYKLPDAETNPDVYWRLFNILNKLDVKHFFYIGGNDSMDTIKKLSNYAKEINSDITFIGVPKTIDNDLAVTDHTPGYGSAAKYIASAMKEIIRDAKTYPTDSITVVEIMGRNAGWLTAASALSRSEDCTGPDLIYLPEVEFDHDKFINKIRELKKYQHAVIVAVSEGIKTADGKYVCEANKKNVFEDSFGHKALGGTALYLADFLGEETGIKSRGIVFSTLQRCASHIVSRRDITEAYTAGADAVQLALNGETGKMIIFDRISNNPYQIKTSSYDVNLIANVEKCVPLEWITDDNTYIAKEFHEYASPLIIGELSPFMVDGLPRHLFIDK
ncbi:MAG: 6-phosphofructokinase [Oscillospiraceae bacterium]|nr:6-phosphofructokinase [Oscillospiraceae bacterium]